MNLIAKILLTVAAIQYGFVPPIVDFTETHVFHPDWSPHARFHLVWLLALGAALASCVIFCVWSSSSRRLAVLRQASVSGCLVLGAFFLAAAFRSQYGGSLTDLAEPIEVLGIDGNVFSFAIASIFQVTGTVIVWRGGESTGA